jgi:hypothetical protein
MLADARADGLLPATHDFADTATENDTFVAHPIHSGPVSACRPLW